MADRAVFLDRDGTIIEEVGYLSDPEGVSLLPGSAEALRKLKKAGFSLVVVTNQSGIARGYFTEGELEKVNAKLDDALREKGAAIDAYYFCPHHPEHGVKKDCGCRKPKTGMADAAARKLGLDLSRSYFVGDKRTDVELGINAGGFPVLVLTGFGREEKQLLDAAGVTGYEVFNGLPEAADWIVEHSKKS